MNFASSPSWQSGVAVFEDNVFERQDLPEDSALREKRKDARFNIQVPLLFRVLNQPGSWQEVETKDVSNTGIRIELEELAPLGTRLELDVLLPGATNNIKIEGTVVWTRPAQDGQTTFECGIAFQNLKRVTGKDKFLQYISDKLCHLAIKHAPKNLDCRPVSHFQEMKNAFRLIYKEYSFRGYCNKQASQMHYTFYSLLPDSRTFALKRDGNLLGTLSLIADSGCGLPMEELFKEKIQLLRQKKRRIAEVSLLALDREAFHKKSFSLTDFQKLTGTFRLFKLLFDYARLSAGITDLVIAVHPKHEDLYRYLTFEPIGSVRSYASACGKPALPMRLDIEKSKRSIPKSRTILKYFVDHVTPKDILSESYTWTTETLRELLMETNTLWYDLPDHYRAFLRSCYPGLSN